ncbi:sulfotransferase [Phytohabitans rumicis]|uniref:sulfotransferase family protein n=1 Tax=Phytohabitans rumicis TaxID=1076125 RepID=UPI0031E833C5
MGWKDQVLVRLTRATGVQVLRQAGGRRGLSLARRERMLVRPTFILSSVRSGSTLLRMILNSHPEIYAPHELHLSSVKVDLCDHYAEKSMGELGLPAAELTHMLWDRMLDHALRKSGKSVLVEKTPNHVFMWNRLARCWPDAQFIFLLRHPAAIVESWARARPEGGREGAAASVGRYAAALNDARRVLPGHTVRYEDLVADPEKEGQALCDFLGVRWEPAMLEYGRFEHGAIKAGLGDWTQRIRSGRVQPPRQLPPATDLPDGLRAVAEDWGYV